jgi:hypothetical protein
MADETRERERRYREILEQLGPDVVRQRFTNRMLIWEPEVYGINPPPDAFIVAWLAKKNATARWLDARRFRIVSDISTCETELAA